jgi:HlyD family secretion protein
MVKRLLFLALAAAILVVLLLYSQLRTEPLKVSGIIEADEIRLGSRVGGRVAAIHIAEGDSVSEGQVLVELDPFDLRARLEEADADLARAEAELSRLEAGFREEEIAQAKAKRDRLEASLEMLIDGPREEDIAAARARLQLAEAELERAQSRHARVTEAAQRDAANEEEIDDAVRSLKVTQASVNLRQEELRKLEVGTRKEEIAEGRAQLAEAEAALRLQVNGYRPEEIAEARAAVAAARQRANIIQQQIDELTIRSPADGVIETMDLQVGDLVPANAPALSMVDRRELWIRAYVPEKYLDFTLGEIVDVTIDAWPDERFAGRIGYIARQGEFTPSNLQTPEDRSRQVFRIKVYLVQGLDRLRPGLYADVWLDTTRPPGRDLDDEPDRKAESGAAS